MRADWTSLVGGALIALAVSGGAAAANNQQPQENSAAVAKARLSGSFYVPTNQTDVDAYCAKVAHARLSGSFFVPTTTPRNCELETEPKR